MALARLNAHIVVPATLSNRQVNFDISGSTPLSNESNLFHRFSNCSLTQKNTANFLSSGGVATFSVFEETNRNPSLKFRPDR